MNISNVYELESGIEILTDYLYSDTPYEPYKNLLYYDFYFKTQSTTSNGSSSNSTSVSSNYPLYATMIRKHNYFAGMRITLLNSVKKLTEEEDYKTVTPLRREYLYTQYTNTISVVNKTNTNFTF